MKLFQRRKENFICGNCGCQVIGTGYTNHCPKCLYSKHVDVHPGDRLETCQGLMKPIGIEQSHGKYIIVHQCQNCKAIKKNKTEKGDNFDQILELAK